jgi:hypothetical protein
MYSAYFNAANNRHQNAALRLDSQHVARGCGGRYNLTLLGEVLWFYRICLFLSQPLQLNTNAALQLMIMMAGR